ncbi:MAG: phosphotransferase family protein [Candidatus Hodarchaeota archaeon]
MNGLKIGNVELNPDEFSALLEPGKEAARISNNGRMREIKGPFDGKINSIYMIDFQDGNQEKPLIFRARISKAFRYEKTIKEKLLYPILDGSLKLQENDELRTEVKRIIEQKKGSYLFSKEKPPVINVQEIYHFDETCKQIPYFFTIMEYIPGISLYNFIEVHGVKNKKANEISSETRKKLENMLFVAGESLGKLHELKFPGFYNSILDIGKKDAEVEWKELFFSKVNLQLEEAARHHQMKDLIQDLQDYFKKNVSLIDKDVEPVLFHNDYQPQNIIVDDARGYINGFIDHDNWQIGAKEQDFVKIQYWGMKGLDPRLFNCFLEGYKSIQKIDKDFQKRVNLYKMAWFILVFNFEMDKIMKNEGNVTVDKRFPSAEKYITDIKQILHG